MTNSNTDLNWWAPVRILLSKWVETKTVLPDAINLDDVHRSNSVLGLI